MAKSDPRIREIQVIGNIHVFLVHGRKVRDEWNVDFTMGANSQARAWMPQDPPEIWIDDSNHQEEQFILLHELHEYLEMLDLGIGYERAHGAANVLERKARDVPARLPKLLAREIARALKIQAELAQDAKPRAYDTPFFTVMDEEFEENKHPRDQGGRFAAGSGGGGSASGVGASGSAVGGASSSSAFTSEGKLTPEAHAAVKAWMEDDWSPLMRLASKRALTEGDYAGEDKITQADADRVNKQATILQAAASSSKTSHELLFRGEAYAQEDVPKFKEGQVINIDRLTSTSGDRDIGSSFSSPEAQGVKGGVGVLYVFAGEDKKGLDLNAAMPGSKMQEDETLLPVGEHYTVTHVRKAGGKVVVHATRMAEPIQPLKMQELKKVGGQLGSNAGGVYEKDGQRYYIKKGRSKDHVKNELLAGDLYKLAGARTVQYVPVEGGDYIATKWEKADKTSAKTFTPEELMEAQKDFAVHAWLSNWDATGLDYDNQMLIAGKPVSVDLGGALNYRAQGAPKGAAFGDKVGEWDTLRDPKVNPQNAKLFGGMNYGQLRQSADKVVNVPDALIKNAVRRAGLDESLANKLIARKKDIANRAGVLGVDAAHFGPLATPRIPGAYGPLLAHHTDSEGYTVSIVDHIQHPKDLVMGRKGQMFFTDPHGNVAKGGYWMDLPEASWGLADKEYRALPKEHRAALEAKQQATAYKGLKHTFDFHTTEGRGKAFPYPQYAISKDEEIEQPQELTVENDPRFSIDISDFTIIPPPAEEEPGEEDDDDFGEPVPEAQAPPATATIHIYEK